MKADKKDRLKDLLKSAADDKPTADFTKAVMKAVESDAFREVALRTVLKKEEAVGPSFSFTANVMAGIQANKNRFIYQPIITKKAWYSIGALFVLFAVIICLPGSATNDTAGNSSITTLVSYTYAIPPVYSLIMAIIVVLLAVDYFVNRYKNQSANKLG